MPLGRVGRVGVSRFPDGADADLQLGYNAEGIVTELHGKYYQNTLRGNSYMYSSAAAGVTLAALGNNLPTLWNPSGSGKNLVLNKVLIGWVSTTWAVGNIVYGYQTNVGSAIGTGAPISVFTAITPVNLNISGAGSPQASVMRFATTVTFTTAPTFLATAGINSAALAAATAASNFIMMDDLDGRIVIGPGAALQVAANGAVAGVCIVSIYGTEIPIPTVA